MFTEDDLKFMARLMVEEGMVYYNIVKRGINEDGWIRIGYVRVNLSYWTWEIVERFLRLVEVFEGKVSTSAAEEMKSWKVTGRKSVEFLKLIFAYVNEEHMERMIKLYIAGWSDNLRGKKMTRGELEDRKEIEAEIKQLRDKRKQIADMISGKLEINKVERDAGIYGEDKNGVIPLQDFLMRDFRRGVMKEAVKQMEKVKEEKELIPVSEEFRSAEIELNRRKLERHAREMKELERQLGIGKGTAED